MASDFAPRVCMLHVRLLKVLGQPWEDASALLLPLGDAQDAQLGLSPV